MNTNELNFLGLTSIDLQYPHPDMTIPRVFEEYHAQKHFIDEYNNTLQYALQLNIAIIALHQQNKTQDLEALLNINNAAIETHDYALIQLEHPECMNIPQYFIDDVKLIEQTKRYFSVLNLDCTDVGDYENFIIE